MGNYTPEQASEAFEQWYPGSGVEGCTSEKVAARFGFHAGAAYAATLRQQAGRVDASDLDVLRRLRDALPTVGLNGWMAGVGALDAAITALAQNTQWDGEPVGHVRGIAVRSGGSYAAIEFTGESLPYGTPLYLHAERARVPDGWALLPREPTSQMSAAFALIESRGFRKCYQTLLAAAPSQRAEVK